MLDGIEKDERGNIYVSEPYRNEISVFSPDGTQRIVIATADTAPIVNPTSLIYRKGIPPEVQMVIDSYKARRMHLAMIAMDGTDIAAESIWGESYSGGPDMVSRWAGWQTDPP